MYLHSSFNTGHCHKETLQKYLNSRYNFKVIYTSLMGKPERHRQWETHRHNIIKKLNHLKGHYYLGILTVQWQRLKYKTAPFRHFSSYCWWVVCFLWYVPLHLCSWSLLLLNISTINLTGHLPRQQKTPVSHIFQILKPKKPCLKLFKTSGKNLKPN